MATQSQSGNASVHGIAPRWTSSAKAGVGTAMNPNARIWFTVSHGIINEVYHPHIDWANTRDFGLLVTDKNGFFSEEKRDTEHHIAPLAQGVPGFRLTNTCKDGRFRIEKIVFAAPDFDSLVQKVTFTPLKGTLDDYRLYTLLAPHIGNQGADNRGTVAEYKGIPMLFASRAHIALALSCSAPWKGRSVGYVGSTDGWQDIRAHGRMTHFAEKGGPGNIALTGEIDLVACNGEFVLTLSFGSRAAEAGLMGRATLLTDVEAMKTDYIKQWQEYQRRCLDLPTPKKGDFDVYRVSTAVLRTHEAKRFRGGIVASLSIPWGFSKGDQDAAGYHVVWPRDQVEAATAQIAAGDAQSARETLFYLMTTQEADGHWPQNMWLDGIGHWNGLQTDETAFPILLAHLLQRYDALGEIDPYPMVRRAALFLLKQGPMTPQDRWEENAGYSPFTLAAVITALRVAADMADGNGENGFAAYLRETADCWNDYIESWTYVTGTDLSRQHGVDGYYVRIAPSDVPRSGTEKMGTIAIKNHPSGSNSLPAAEIISPDALALVRFGLRAPEDPRIRNTVNVIDACLRTDTRTGPVWHRYNHDGYGEHPDGGPYDGSGGIGRGWPLLAGERAHYELARGNHVEAERLLGVMAAQTSPGGLLPEQIWDSEDIPDRELFNGHPSGSGMPLVWAHAEFVKLVRSLRDGRIFDMPQPAPQRYRNPGQVTSPYGFWRFDVQNRSLWVGRKLRIETLAPAQVRWSDDDWRTVQDTRSEDTGTGIWKADLPTEHLSPGTTVRFTFCWPDAERWEGKDFGITVIEAENTQDRGWKQNEQAG